MNNEPRSIRVPLFVKNHTGPIDPLHPRDRRGDGFRQAVHSGTRSSRMGLFLRYTNLQSGGKPWSISATRTKALAFGGAAVLLWAATWPLHALFVSMTGVEPIIGWFALGGLVFATLIVAGCLLLRAEGKPATSSLSDRLRLLPLNRSDWIWTIGGIAAVGVSTGVVMVFIVGIAQSAQPAFLSLTPLGADRLWILLVWVPFWLLNILGEEFLWRGVILPRQELAFGQHAWLANAAGWLVFHLACGWAVILLVTPIVFILPWIVQKRRNSSIGIIIHAALNGPAFIAVALGFA